MDLTAIETVAGQLVDMGWKNEGNGFGTLQRSEKVGIHIKLWATLEPFCGKFIIFPPVFGT
jgi:hypothetical protein